MANENKSLKEDEEKAVRSLISFTADAEKADEIGKSLSRFPFVEDVLLLTGDFDFMVKASFESYDRMKRFLTIDLGEIEGVEDPTSMMIVSAYKEGSEFIKAEEPENEKTAE